MDVVVVKNLTRRYGNLTAVDGISFSIARGEVFGLLGPNGAGKTTTLRMLCGLLSPDDGTIQVLGRGVDRLSAATSVGLCPQEIVVWDGLTVEEQLLYVGAIHDVPSCTARQRAAALLQGLGLEEKVRRLAATLSGGMKRRLNIALALMHDPQILVLDEPQAGLDPQGRVLVREFVRTMAGSRTVILTTHDMEEADKLSSRVAILDHGKILAEGEPEALKASYSRGDLLEFRVDVSTVPERLLEGNDWSTAVGDGVVRVTARDPISCLAELRERLARHGRSPEDVHIRRYSLEDLFLDLTGRGLRE